MQAEDSVNSVLRCLKLFTAWQILPGNARMRMFLAKSQGAKLGRFSSFYPLRLCESYYYSDSIAA
jgi:hypothetical protein